MNFLYDTLNIAITSDREVFNPCCSCAWPDGVGLASYCDTSIYVRCKYPLIPVTSLFEAHKPLIIINITLLKIDSHATGLDSITVFKWTRIARHSEFAYATRCHNTHISAFLIVLQHMCRSSGYGLLQWNARSMEVGSRSMTPLTFRGTIRMIP